jgi:hypothetical protein
MKKEWKKPQLVVVMRGYAEENVLIGCKLPSGIAESPQIFDMSCLGAVQAPVCGSHCNIIMNS